MRKIVHVDMDAFYASVEQRDDPSLRGKPVVVAWRGARSVVCAASYEARTFGIRSAMPAMRAERLCPDAVFVPPDFARYKAVSRQVREIFHRHTDLVEPLSLDEAYLDVTQAKTGMQLATEIAQLIRTQIREETQLTASAGIAPNKFLAKIASDWRKPDGQFVIAPSRVDAFLLPLPVNRIPGVGKVMDGKLAALGIVTVSDLRLRPWKNCRRISVVSDRACIAARVASTSVRSSRIRRCSRSPRKTPSAKISHWTRWIRTSCAWPKKPGSPRGAPSVSGARWC